MIYGYNCEKCSNEFDVVKSADLMEREENCAQCGEVATRQFLPHNLYLNKTSVTHAEFNPAFGKVIKNKSHLKDELSRHEDRTGSKMVEIGNDFGSGLKMAEKYKNEKQKERERSWDSLKPPLP